MTAQAEAFVRSLYDDAAGPLFAFVVRLTGDRVRAEDVVQETLVRAWRRAEHLDPGSDALRGWLCTVKSRTYYALRALRHALEEGTSASR
ncbi:sigma factor [Pseudonocardia xinjiangensis]|uniref:sigma factor n=1 Tax=Pseudonocardia xinjiangensis TaxID=75289 RepID=UPI003D9074EE